jgi:hypothetical protein
MEWLKKHWEILAAIAVGIPVFYWLYQTYQSNSAANAQAAQSTALQNEEQADEAAYAQQVALAQLGSDSSGGSTGSSVSTQGNVTTSTPVTSSASTSVASPVDVSSDPVASSGVDPTLLAPPPNQNPDYSYSQNSSVTNNPNPIYPAGSPQAIALGYSPSGVADQSQPSTISVLLGSGGGNNDTAPVAVQAVTPDLSDGSIPVHGTALPASPTPVEQATVRGFPGR